MNFFIDTADLDQIYEANNLGIIDGVTTNPSLISKQKINKKNDLYKHYLKICEIIQGDVSAEVISNNYKDMCYESQDLSNIHPQIVIKIPITINGIRAIRYCSQKGIRTNCTLVFSISQAILAAKVGATYISPFIGRLDDISSHGIHLIQNIKIVYDNYKFKTKILAASIRDSIHIINCSKIGVDVITAPLKIIKNLIYHPLTDKGLKKFIDDYQKNFS